MFTFFYRKKGEVYHPAKTINANNYKLICSSNDPKNKWKQFLINFRNKVFCAVVDCYNHSNKKNTT